MMVRGDGRASPASGAWPSAGMSEGGSDVRADIVVAVCRNRILRRVPCWSGLRNRGVDEAMKHFIGGFAFGVVFLELLVVYMGRHGIKNSTTLQTNVMWGICFGLAAWGLFP